MIGAEPVHRWDQALCCPPLCTRIRPQGPGLPPPGHRPIPGRQVQHRIWCKPHTTPVPFIWLLEPKIWAPLFYSIYHIETLSIFLPQHWFIEIVCLTPPLPSQDQALEAPHHTPCARIGPYTAIHAQSSMQGHNSWAPHRICGELCRLDYTAPATGSGLWAPLL